MTYIIFRLKNRGLKRENIIFFCKLNIKDQCSHSQVTLTNMLPSFIAITSTLSYSTFTLKSNLTVWKQFNHLKKILTFFSICNYIFVLFPRLLLNMLKYYLKTFYWLAAKLLYMFFKAFNVFSIYIVIRCSLFSMWKSLRVLQKARIKIVALAIYTNLFFPLHTLSFFAAK